MGGPDGSGSLFVVSNREIIERSVLTDESKYTALGYTLNLRLYDLGVQRLCLLNFAGWIEAQFRH